jgi:hypothetical protein
MDLRLYRQATCLVLYISLLVFNRPEELLRQSSAILVQIVPRNRKMDAPLVSLVSIPSQMVSQFRRGGRPRLP